VIPQSRRGSIREAIFGTVVGYVIALLAQETILPWWGFHASLGSNAVIGGLFTVISLSRSVVTRRLCNGPLRRFFA